MKRIFIVVCAALAVVALCAAAASAAITFTNIGNGVASGLSSDGSVVSYTYSSQAYIYSGGLSYAIGGLSSCGVEKVGSTVYVGGKATVGSASGAAVWQGNASGVGAWTVATGATNTFTPNAMAVNQSTGQVWLAGQMPPTTNKAATWTSTTNTITQFDWPTGYNIPNLFAVSSTGQVAGQIIFTGGRNNPQPYAGEASGPLVVMNGEQGAPSNALNNRSMAWGISRDSDTIVGDGYANAAGTLYQAAYWTRTGATWTAGQAPTLVPFTGALTGNTYSRGNSVSDNGIIAGYTVKTSAIADRGTRTVYYWDSATPGAVPLNLKTVLTDAGYDLSGWVLMYATSLSSDGRTLTGYMLPSNDPFFTGGSVTNPYSTFVVTIPEPSSFAVLAIGLVGLIRRRRS